MPAPFGVHDPPEGVRTCRTYGSSRVIRMNDVDCAGTQVPTFAKTSARPFVLKKRPVSLSTPPQVYRDGVVIFTLTFVPRLKIRPRRTNTAAITTIRKNHDRNYTHAASTTTVVRHNAPLNRDWPYGSSLTSFKRLTPGSACQSLAE